MVRFKVRGAIGVLSTALATACLGGQTGQPSSATCEGRTLSSSAAWGGTSVAAAAAAFVGTYEAPLLWQASVIGFHDRLQLTIRYDGGSASQSCLDRLTVPVTVGLTSSDSGIAESGAATLEIMGSPGARVGVLHYAGERVALDVTLTEAAAGVELAGALEALDEHLPGAFAGFALEP